MKIKKLVGAGIVAGALAVTSTAGAAVTFDPATGSGFVGKGDVQLALGLNDAQLQAAASGLAFTYEDELTLSQECEKDGNKQTLTKTQKRERSISSTVTYDARRNKQQHVTGFNLNGYPNGTGGFVLPTDICPDPHDNHGGSQWHPADSDGSPAEVQILSQTGGTLKVNGVAIG